MKQVTEIGNPLIPTREVTDDFQKYFGVSLNIFKDVSLMVLSRKFVFDLLKFEKHLIKLGYEADADGISISSFIVDRWGSEADALVQSLVRVNLLCLYK